MTLRGLCLLVIGFSFTAPVQAGEPTGFHKRTYTDAAGAKFKYTVFVPRNFNQRTSLAGVLLFLHGSGEVKGGNQQPVDVGLGAHIRKHEKTFPFLAVFPQSQDEDHWNTTRPSAERALGMLDEVIAHYKANPKRVYLTGLSMGGNGTWAFAAKSPERWAAIVPICARHHPKAVDKIKDLPCWAFHGLADETSPVSGTKDMIAALKRAGGNPEVTYFPNTGHNSWDKAYATPALWKWLASKSLP